MTDPTPVYDLGEISERPRRPPSSPASSPSRAAAAPHRLPYPATFPASVRFDAASAVAYLIPGCGHLLRGETRPGLLHLSAIGFLAALAWAILATLDRLTEALVLLELPRESGVWALGALYAGACFIHLSSLLSAPPEPRLNPVGSRPDAIVAGVASGMVPGLGQMLRGHRGRAAGIAAALWVLGAGWILSSQAAASVLASAGMAPPDLFGGLPADTVLGTATVVVWALSFYDAAARA